MMLSTVAAFFDESGKFKDHEVISVGCVGGYVESFDRDLAPDWLALLNFYGLEMLTCKEALNYKRPFDRQESGLGLEDRSRALVSFIACLRKHVQLISGLAVEVKAYRQLPSHFFQVFGSIYVAFVRNALFLLSSYPCGTCARFTTLQIT
jgi:hypothetical protein